MFGICECAHASAYLEDEEQEHTRHMPRPQDEEKKRDEDDRRGCACAKGPHSLALKNVLDVFREILALQHQAAIIKVVPGRLV